MAAAGAAPPPTPSNSYSAGGTAYTLVYHFHTSDAVPLAADDGQKTCDQMLLAYAGLGFEAALVTPHDAVADIPGTVGILQIQGTEHTAQQGDPVVEKHVVGMFVAERIYPGAWPDIATLVPLIVAGGAFPVAAHSNYALVPIDNDDLDACDFLGVEVWNQQVENMYPGEGIADDRFSRMIDNALADHIVVGLAASDAHDTGAQIATVPWNVVFATALSAAAIETSIRAGNFYATQGTLITSIAITGNVVSMVLPAACTVEWIVTGNQVAATQTSTTAPSFMLMRPHRWVRARITNGAGLIAWTQPFYVT